MNFTGSSLAFISSHLLSQFIPGAIKHVLYNSTERGLWNLVPGFLYTSSNIPFPFANFALFSFIVKNNSI